MKIKHKMGAYKSYQRQEMHSRGYEHDEDVLGSWGLILFLCIVALVLVFLYASNIP